MWLELNQRYSLSRDDPADSVVSWRADVWASVDSENHEPGQPISYVIGRLLADEIRRFEGCDPMQVADADSGGLLAAYMSLVKDGEFREDFEGVAEPFVFLYRFALHDDFAAWRLPILDVFCRRFGHDAVIATFHDIAGLSLDQLETVAFVDANPTTNGNPRRERFLVRDNARGTDIDYPKDFQSAAAKHEKWVNEAMKEWET